VTRDAGVLRLDPMRLTARPDQAALAVIATFTVLRLVLAATLGLGVDEAYTLSAAHDLHLSYYDHPPLQYWIAHLFLPLLGDGRAARLPFIALFAASSWLLYRLTRQLFGAQAGLLAVVALNCSACFTFAFGDLVLPDGPLLLALLAAALVLARGLFPENESPSAYATWLHAGLWIGVGALCKYHVLLFAAGVLLFLLSVPSRRRLLAQPAPWLGALLAVAIAAPVIVWNVRHDWISIGFQAERGRPGGGLHAEFVAANVAGQAIWMLPWIFVPMAIAAWSALRAGRAAQRSWYCLCLALPTLVLFTLIPLWGRVGLPHWQMPGWLLLFPVFGDWAARFDPRRLRHWGYVYASLVVAIAAVIVAEAASGYGRILAPRAFARGDPTLDAFEWSQLPPALRSRGLLRPGEFVVTSNWIYAGRIAQSLHDTVPVVVFGSNQKEFGLRYDPQSFLGRDAIVVGPVDSMRGIENGLRAHFLSIEELAPLALGRSGMREIELRLLVAHDLRMPLPAPYWRAR